MWLRSGISHYLFSVAVAVGLLFGIGKPAHAVLEITICGSANHPRPSCSETDPLGYLAVPGGTSLDPAGSSPTGSNLGGLPTGSKVVDVTGTNTSGVNVEVDMDAQMPRSIAPPAPAPQPVGSWAISSNSWCPNASASGVTYGSASDALNTCAAEDYSRNLASSFWWAGTELTMVSSVDYGLNMQLGARSDNSEAWYLRPYSALETMTCPSPWTISGTSCVVSGRLPEVSDNKCQVIRSGSSFYGDPQDPDCGTIGFQNSASHTTVTVSDGPNGVTITATSMQFSIPRGDGTTDVTTVGVDTSGRYAITNGTSTSNFNGTGTQTSGTANNNVNATVNFPAGLAQDSTLQGIKDELKTTATFQPPTLADAPTIAQTIANFNASVAQSPIGQVFDVSVGDSAGTCPATTQFTIFGHQFSFSYFCTLADGVLGMLGPVMDAIWGISAVFIILSA